MRAILLPLFLAGLAVVAPSQAAESYDACAGTISTLPAIITTQGVWCLKSDLATGIMSGSAILINANNVTIDCNGFKLGGLSAGADTTTYGIANAAGRSNSVVRNCSIRGFFTGVALTTGSGHNVEHNRFDGNTYAAIHVDQPGSHVVGNYVLDTGGTTVVPSAVGIFGGMGMEILDNSIDGVLPADLGENGQADGIYLSGNSGTLVANNRIRNVVSRNAGIAFGIHLASSGNGVIRNNNLWNASANSVGIQCVDYLAFALENVLSGMYPSGVNTCYQQSNYGH